MKPRFLLLSIALILLPATAAFAQGACNLGITLSCNSTSCTSTTVNNGSNSCTGEFVIAMELITQTTGSVGALQYNLPLQNVECLTFPSSLFPTITTPLSACVGDGSLAAHASFSVSAGVNPGTNGSISNVVAATVVIDDNGDTIGQAYVSNGGAVAPTCTPVAFVPPSVQSGNSYVVSWSAVVDPSATYTVEESTASDFSAISGSQTTSTLSATFQHTVTSPTTFYYHVRANSCSGAPGANSTPISTVVQIVPVVTGRQGDVTAPVGSTGPVTMRVFIPSPSGKKQAQDVGFTATTDKPYLTVSPSSGTIGPNGTTLTITANPSALPTGANTGTLTVSPNGSTPVSKSVSVSLVTPVSPAAKGLPPANALIIPAVAHSPGALGPFQSDVRLTNAGSASTSYQLTYTPQGTDGTQTSKATTISIDAGQTIALNDILRDFFGVGATDAAGDAGQGSLEIRPVGSASTLNYASSRTFTFNANGTFGQFVAAIPFSTFATKQSIVNVPGVPPPTGTPTISLQQISCCTGAFRTNLGIAEGAGTPATGNIKLYDDQGSLKATVPYSLRPGEQQQKRFQDWGLPEISDGRVEVTVESSTGAVTAYASVLDNRTNDPLEVVPVQVANISANRYIQPGVANLPGVNNFHSDVRVYNGGTSAVSVTPTLYSFIGSAPRQAAAFTIQAGEVKSFDDIVQSMFNAPGDGGSVVFTTSAASSLVTTGRTYTIDPTQNNGTFGQFIPGVTSAQGIAAGDQPLQILQLEESTNFRTNLGLVELTGNPVTVHVTAFVPDSKITASTDIPLQANQFVQQNRILASMYPSTPNIYNARIAVSVTGGTGRVAAYGSVIDNKSLDPTYVPAQ